MRQRNISKEIAIRKEQRGTSDGKEPEKTKTCPKWP